MFVIKRNGRREPVQFDKITARIKKLAYGLNVEFCDPVRGGRRVGGRRRRGIRTLFPMTFVKKKIDTHPLRPLPPLLLSPLPPSLLRVCTPKF